MEKFMSYTEVAADRNVKVNGLDTWWMRTGVCPELSTRHATSCAPTTRLSASALADGKAQPQPIDAGPAGTARLRGVTYYDSCDEGYGSP